MLLFRFLAIGLCAVCVTLAADRNDEIVDLANSGEPGTLDPHLYFTNLEEHILKDLFVGLTTMNAQGEIVPGCAESWDVSSDQRTWTFHLRDDLRWSDGTQLSAHDFVHGFRRILTPTTAASLAFFLYSIENAKEVNSGDLEAERLGVFAPDEHTVVIRLEQPFPFLAERLLYPVAYPTPTHVLTMHGENWIKADNWVSNGPYVLHEWRPHEYVEIRKNQMFFDAANVNVEIVRFYPITESVTAYNRYLAGELDIIGNYPKGVHSSLQKEFADHVKNAPLQSIMYLVFNTRKKPFNDMRVRKALALAIDRQIIVDRILGLGELASTTLSPPIVDGHHPVEYSHKRNVSEAIRLLKEAGFDSELIEIELRHVADDEQRNIYIAIASMWREIGVETRLNHSTLADHFSNLNQGNFEVAQAGWFGENNPEHYIELLWSRIGAANYGAYGSIAFDTLLDKAKATGDLQTRLKLLNEAESVALNEYPVIPLYVVNTRSLVNPALNGWHRNGRNLHPARYFSWD